MNHTDTIDKIKDYEESYAEQINHAKLAVEKISATTKISLSDRSLFAQNLGRLFDEYRSEEPKFNFARLFDLTFKKDVSESLQKKRKTLILLDGEEQNSMGLAASPRMYLEILKTLDDLFLKSRGTQKGYCFIRFIRNTSYDYNQSLMDTITLEQRKELGAILDKVVDEVRKSVDLRWMYEWLEQFSTATIGPVGTTVAIAKPGERAHLPAMMRFCDDNRWNNGIAPCVRLATIEKPVAVSDFFRIPINHDESLSEKENLINTLQLFISSIDDFEGKDTSSLGTELVWEMEAEQFWQVFFDAIQAYGYNVDRLPILVNSEMFIDLEILFDQYHKEWKPLFIKRREINFANNLENADETLATVDQSRAKIFMLGELFSGFESPVLACTHYVGDQCYGYYFFYDHHQTKLEDDITSDLAEPYFYPAEDFFSLFMSSVYDMNMSINFEIDGLKKVLQPSDSLAAYMVNNLLYMPEEENIMHRLIKDGQRKERLLKEHARSLESEYKSSLARFLKGSTQ